MADIASPEDMGECALTRCLRQTRHRPSDPNQPADAPVRWSRSGHVGRTAPRWRPMRSRDAEALVAQHEGPHDVPAGDRVRDAVCSDAGWPALEHREKVSVRVARRSPGVERAADVADLVVEVVGPGMQREVLVVLRRARRAQQPGLRMPPARLERALVGGVPATGRCEFTGCQTEEVGQAESPPEVYDLGVIRAIADRQTASIDHAITVARRPSPSHRAPSLPRPTWRSRRRRTEPRRRGGAERAGTTDPDPLPGVGRPGTFELQSVPHRGDPRSTARVARPAVRSPRRSRWTSGYGGFATGRHRPAACPDLPTVSAGGDGHRDRRALRARATHATRAVVSRPPASTCDRVANREARALGRTPIVMWAPPASLMQDPDEPPERPWPRELLANGRHGQHRSDCRRPTRRPTAVNGPPRRRRGGIGCSTCADLDPVEVCSKTPTSHTRELTKFRGFLDDRCGEAGAWHSYFGCSL